MMWNLPTAVDINGKKFEIRNKCDYRVVLDVIESLKDEDLEMEHRIQCALTIFYEDLSECDDMQVAVDEMTKIINLGNDEETEKDNKPPVMDWKHDFQHIVPPINRVLGYSVRDENHYTHWFDFIGAYQEIGECSWANIVSIRSKRIKGKPLEQWEREFYNENRKLIDLPRQLTNEEQEWLDSDW